MCQLRRKQGSKIEIVTIDQYDEAPKERVMDGCRNKGSYKSYYTTQKSRIIQHEEVHRISGSRCQPRSNDSSQLLPEAMTPNPNTPQ
jgi:hypothetical protein